MDPTLLLLRWAHVLAAIVAMGGLVFARFALLPALVELDADTRDRIHDRIRRRWLPWVIGAITLLLVSGLLNFFIFQVRVSPPREGGLTRFVTAIAPGVEAEDWAEGVWMRQHSYHALFGAKLLLAMVAFYFASALVGRGTGTQWVRDDRAKWLSVTLGLTLAVVMLSGWMRQLHTGPNKQPHEVQSNGIRMGGFGGDGGGEPADGERRDRYDNSEAGSRFRAPPADAASPAAETDAAPPPAAPGDTSPAADAGGEPRAPKPADVKEPAAAPSR